MATKTRNVLFVFVGVAGFLIQSRYSSGPWRGLVRSYGGNVAASFAVYFILTNLFLRRRFGKFLAAAAAMAVVELFEAFDGFGVMQNTYDPVDFAANAVGIALALALDAVVSAGFRKREAARAGAATSR